MAGIEQGKVFTPEDLKKARERLLKLDVFSSVTVREGKAEAADGTLPVQVEVGERKFRYYGVGATYSNTDGAGVSGYWGHRNLFGRAERCASTPPSRASARPPSATRSARPTSSTTAFRAVFKKPGVLGPDSVYVGSIEAVSEHPLAYDRDSIAVTSRRPVRADRPADDRGARSAASTRRSPTISAPTTSSSPPCRSPTRSTAATTS